MNRRAFTLIEAVVALALFTLCAGILLQTLAGTRLALFNGLRGAASDADRRLAVRSILAAPDMRAATKDGRLTNLDGDVLRWRCEVTPTAVADLHKISMYLRKEKKDGDTTEDTVTLFALRPAWSDPVARAAMIESKKAANPSPYPAN